jgi:hypothetical protein
LFCFFVSSRLRRRRRCYPSHSSSPLVPRRRGWRR